MEDLMLQSDCFGDALRLGQDDLDAQNFYAYNPEFDRADCFKKNEPRC
jgi:hypothetical protein